MAHIMYSWYDLLNYATFLMFNFDLWSNYRKWGKICWAKGLNFHIFHGFQEHRGSFPVNNDLYYTSFV